MTNYLGLMVLLFCAAAMAAPTTKPSAEFNVRDFGAVGDGTTLDSPAINQAIEAAVAAGGGIVRVPAGDYLSASIRLKSNVTLQLDRGATIIAATAAQGTYDAPEDNPDAGKYEDAGHRHWHNSLIWGEHLTNVAIVGEGTVWGKGLSRGKLTTGGGDKAIALKLCDGFVMRGITIKHGGHFGLLATGVDDMELDDLTIDTDRDGMDIDCCHNVHVAGCRVNSPFDDGICLKSSYGLGYNRDCENVVVTDCQVSGYDEGTLIDGTMQRKHKKYDDGATGRIKLGTESNGGFKHVLITNCVFTYSRGLALETVDGGVLEDVTATNLAMHDILNSPIFIRLADRLSGPPGTTVGAIRHVVISHVVCDNADSRYGCIISGIPGYDIEDVKLSDIHIECRGGGTRWQATTQPAEREKGRYPEPLRWHIMPDSAMFIRHVKGIELDNVTFTFEKPDYRPPFVLDDVEGATFNHVTVPHVDDVPEFVEKNVTDVQGD
ncbi:MAG TPA: glycosyl hydrolase family 28-related protein [Tepidisphaeraceae bacterium]|nr:glycosyl hydrolase family 28-related protein [Tepidisphaeraceae bacterium]